jgi:hypothetical protein
MKGIINKVMATIFIGSSPFDIYMGNTLSEGGFMNLYTKIYEKQILAVH